MIKIEKANLADLTEIMAIMEEAVSLLPDSSWYVDDNASFVRKHIENTGFILKAHTGKEIAGFLIIRFPAMEEDNLGRCLSFSKKDLLQTAHTESVAVRPSFRGQNIQSLLIKHGETILQNMEYHHLMASVHPDNQASLISFLRCGFEIKDTVEKYGGLKRHILYKRI